MKYVIRALSIANTVLWIITILFSTTSIYSALKLLPPLGFGFGDPGVSASADVFTLSLPFYIDNGGFYDISDLNVTTGISSHNGTLISNSTTLIPLVSRGGRVERAHNISISMDDMVSKGLISLLFQDSSFDIGVYVGLKYARAIPLQLSTNMTMPWGAPLANLTIGEISFVPINFTHFQIVAPISFENHSFFTLEGTLRLELVDVGAGETNISVPPMNQCITQVKVVVRIGAGIPTEARIYFETSAFTFGPIPVVIPHG